MSDPDAGGTEDPPADATDADAGRSTDPTDAGTGRPGDLDDRDPDSPGDLETRTDDGTTVYVAREEGETGSEGPFLVAYLSPDRDRRYGWLCTNCDTFDNAMDSMGRIECNVCGNFRKPTEWDAAHE